MDPPTRLIAEIEEHRPEFAKMLRWHADHDSDDPVTYTLASITQTAALNDDEFLIVAIACWMYIDNHRDQEPLKDDDHEIQGMGTD